MRIISVNSLPYVASVEGATISMEQNPIKTNLDWALYYLGIGWNPIPVKGKVPMIAKWSPYQTIRISEAQIREWWTQWPNAGIAIITGKISGIAVVDIDQGGKIVGLTPTVMSRTGGGGQHCIYKYPVQGIGCAVGIRDRVDFRGDGGYIVVPPSPHASGNFYEWIMSPDDADLVDLPESIAVLVRERVGQKSPKNWEVIHKGIPEGQRNTEAASYAGKILRDLNPDSWEMTGWDAFLKWNERNTPPLDHKELRTVWESIKSRRTDDLFKESPDNLKSLYEKDKKIGAYKIAKFLVDHHHIKTTDERNREVYVYRDGIYVSGANILGAEIQRILEELSSNNGKKEILEKIKDLTLVDRSVFTVEENLINLENGIFDLKDFTLKSHTPVHLFLNKIPISFDSKVECPAIKSFLESILDPQNVEIIREWAGYALYRRYFIKKAIIFVGEPNTGKTTLISLLTKFVGERNVSGVSLQRISSDKFVTAQLYTKHLNIFDDLSSKDINDNGVFKIATGGGYITGEYKFGNQFTFQNYAKLTFACNKIPSVADTNDEAYFSRWIIIPFNKQVVVQNKFLLDEITSDEELTGFLNFALEGLQRLLETKSFSYSRDPQDIKTEMLKSGSPIANFAFDCLIQGTSEDWLSKEELYEAFAKYARSNELPIATIGEFGKKLPTYVSYISNSKKVIPDPHGGKLKLDTGWRNIKFKTDVLDNHANQASIEDLLNYEELEGYSP